MKIINGIKYKESFKIDKKLADSIVELNNILITINSMKRRVEKFPICSNYLCIEIENLRLVSSLSNNEYVFLAKAINSNLEINKTQGFINLFLPLDYSKYDYNETRVLGNQARLIFLNNLYKKVSKLIESRN